MKIKVLGVGCANCKSLEKLAQTAVEQMNLDASIEKVDDIMKIMEYGVMRTPGLVVDEKVVLSGRIPSLNELKEIISKEM